MSVADNPDTKLFLQHICTADPLDCASRRAAWEILARNNCFSADDSGTSANIAQNRMIKEAAIQQSPISPNFLAFCTTGIRSDLVTGRLITQIGGATVDHRPKQYLFAMLQDLQPRLKI